MASPLLSWHQFHTFYLIKCPAFPSGTGFLVDKLCWRLQHRENTSSADISGLEMPAAKSRCLYSRKVQSFNHQFSSWGDENVEKI